ncbi:MAG: hypothetical protein ABI416_12925 [Ginsengibacter sp.]
MEPNLDEFEPEQRLRPTLLTVLCILTFIGSGWAILSSVWGYTRAAQTVSMFSASTHNKIQPDSMLQTDSAARSGKRGAEFGQKMMVSVSRIMTAENIRKSAIGAIIAGIFTLAGAFLMWRQRRTGFYIYLLGIIIGIIFPFYLYGNNLLAVGISSFSNFFGLLFVALYALNIKTLR